MATQDLVRYDKYALRSITLNILAIISLFIPSFTSYTFFYLTAIILTSIAGVFGIISLFHIHKYQKSKGIILAIISIIISFIFLITLVWWVEIVFTHTPDID